jgi:peptide/nickel transport system ATP-binding protein
MKFSVKISLDNSRAISIDEFEIKNNKINFLFGESGIGKTLISKALLGLLNSDEFAITINDEPYFQYLENLGVRDMLSKSFYVFQEPSSHLSPVQTLEKQLNEGKIKNAPDKKLILENLFPSFSKRQLDEFLKVYPKPFRPSGGEKQRVLNAMAFLAMDKLSFSNAWNALFVFDEPTGHLDAALRNVVLDEVVRMFLKDKPSVLFITHDYSIVSYIKSKFKNLSEFFHYFEVYVSENKLRQRRFEPEEYTAWIASAEKLTRERNESEMVLSVNSGIKVFDNVLYFTEKGKETDLKLRKGETVYLKAPSGTGKTTLAKILLGFLPARFNAKICGEQISGETPKRIYSEKIRGKKITVAFQHAEEALNENATVAETFDALGDFDFENLRETFFEFFGEPYENFARKKIKNLSGGQKQKINLLRTLALNACVTILDEPLNGMDLQSAQAVLSVLKNRMQSGQSFLLISHNEDIFDKIAERTVRLTAATP